MADMKFDVKIRGYDTKQVEEYIEKMQKEYAEVCAYLQEKIKSLETSLGSQEDIANAMVRAQSVARLAEEEGQIKAGKIISDAEIKARSITSMAEIEAERIAKDTAEKRSEIRREMQQIINVASLFLKEAETVENNNEGISPSGSEMYDN